MYKSVILLALTVFTLESHALSKVATTAAPFLGISVDSRGQAMGGAFTGVADDVGALYYNPAGLSRQDFSEITFNTQQWLAGTRFHFFGYHFRPSRHQALGVGFTMLDLGEMAVTTPEEPLGTGEKFLANSLALGVSYAFNFTDHFSLGFTGKYVREQIWHEKAATVALDLGTLFRTPFPGFTIGMSISNMGKDLSMEGRDLLISHDPDPNQQGNNSTLPAYLYTDSFPLPLNFRVGVSQRWRLDRRNRLLLAVDALHPIDNNESLNLGGEYAFREAFFLRGGWHNLFLPHREGGATLGAGLLVPLAGNLKLRVDYVWENHGRLANTHKYALILKWR